MSKRAPVFIEVGIGLALTAFVIFAHQRGGSTIETASLKTYDALARYAGPAPITDSVRIVAIDQESVENLGRWPWPRALTAQLIDEVVASGAKVIGLNVFLTDPDRNQGLEEIGRLEERFKELLAQQAPALQKKKINTEDLQEFLDGDIANARANLDGDSILSQSVEQAVNIVLPMYFIPGDALGKVDALPEYFERDRIALSADAPPVPSAQSATLPLDAYGKVAMAVGHANLAPDTDGTLRRIPPVVRYGEAVFPSFPLQIVREYLKLPRNAINWTSGGFELHKAKIPTDESGLTFVRFAGPAGTIKSFSALDVLSDGLPEKALNDKIVLIGLTAPGAADGAVMVAPGGERITGLEIIANHIENILSQTFIQRPSWAGKMEWTYLGLAAFVVILVLPLMRARFAIPVTAIFFLGTLGGSWYFFVKKGLWVDPAYSASLLAIGFIILVGKRLLFTERGKELAEADGYETNKMLGLSFQGQGMLDLAFEKFRRCPVDDAMKELLYNLALDMERKRMFTKAAAIYEHIATVDPKYKDIAEKIDLLKKAGEGAVFGPLGKKGTDATVVVEGLGQTTTLGRYEVIRELGRGAMGIVYLGRDPKINRQVAIKTLRFTDETDEEAVKGVKERFFREAESAGNLTHPNIIRIFDAGEDQDVAYIAMELLDGVDLKGHCEKSKLLPLTRALEIIIQVAFGLDYAHKQGVVHRDIKPSNIMLLKDGTLRITDFGIARIQATSKTATGAVLGTPAYMSPEQVNGKKVDGRADIFSLGVTLFELLTGEKPFAAETIAALLYRIANVEHSDPREFNNKLPPELLPIINKTLAKDPAQRYQAAGELGADLRQVIRNMNAKSGIDAAHVEEPPHPVVAQKPEPVEVTAPAAPAAADVAASEPLLGEPITAPAPVSAFSINNDAPAISAHDSQMSDGLRDAFAASVIPATIEERPVTPPIEVPAPKAETPPPTIESTQLTHPEDVKGADMERPEGFEGTQLMNANTAAPHATTENDFLSGLEQTFTVASPSNDAVPETKKPDEPSKLPGKGAIPFQIVHSNDVAENAGAEDVFMQALSQDVPPLDGEDKKKQA